MYKWYNWIDTKQPDRARRDIEERHRHAWTNFFEEEHTKKAHAQKLREKQARNREVNQKRMEEEVCREAARMKDRD
jgi:hypothetical protein